MTGIIWAAALLAAALMVMPAAPRRRLVSRPPRVSGGVPVLVAGLAAAAVPLLFLPLTTLLAAAAVTAMAVMRRRRSNRQRRAAGEGRALVAALEVLVGELRIGAHPVRAFEAAAEESTGAVGTALSTVAARSRLGADVASGLYAAASRSALGTEWVRMAVAWQLAADHGMAISAMMRTVQTDIVERQRFRARVQANLAGARATAVILAALPVLGIALGELIGATPIAFLTGGEIGGWFLVAGTGLLCAGLWWADRITDGLPA